MLVLPRKIKKLGADHARAITESGDPNFAKYDLEKMVVGFEQGLKNKEAFDKSCESTIKKLFGNSGRAFDAKHALTGSECIGKLSGVIFNSSWTKNKALDKIDLKLVIKGFTDESSGQTMQLDGVFLKKNYV